MKEFRDLASPEAAREAIASLDLASDPETVPLDEARGRVLAERVDAELDVPGFDRASKDGYAVRARDTFGADEVDPAVLDVAGTVHAGEAPDAAVGEGEAVQVSTGAVMPDGADAVVMVEETTRVEPRSTDGASGETASEEDDGVAVRTSVTPGEDVMLAGADVAAGERALGPGTHLTAREIGLLSALGVDAVPVRGKPTVGVVSTGDELVRPGGELDHRRGQIHDVNSYAIAAGVEEAGGEPALYPHVGDDYDEMERVLREAADDCDLVLSSGSTSAGAVDVVYRVIEERGELLLHGVAVKPGKPTIVGRLEESAYVGLPGYPVSALSIFRTFVAPAIRRAAGLPEPATATVEGRMAARERYGEGRRRLMPAGLVEDEDGEALVYPVDKGSGATTSLVEADGVVAVDADTNYLDADERVTVELFSPDVRPPALLGVGEDDPALARLLDAVDRPRYLSVGTREGIRRLRDGLPDVCVAAGPMDVHPAVECPDGEDLRADQAAAWNREWGLVVPAGNPEGIEGVADLVDRDLRLVNRGTESGLRASLAGLVATLADDRGVERKELVDAIDGFGVAARAHESPARRVAAGDADAGLGLRATATALEMGFVPLGEQAVRVLVHPARVGKPGVDSLVDALGAELPGILDGLDGYE